MGKKKKKALAVPCGAIRISAQQCSKHFSHIEINNFTLISISQNNTDCSSHNHHILQLNGFFCSFSSQHIIHFLSIAIFHHAVYTMGYTVGRTESIHTKLLMFFSKYNNLLQHLSPGSFVQTSGVFRAQTLNDKVFMRTRTLLQRSKCYQFCLFIVLP